jgi:hypothetical protein
MDPECLCVGIQQFFASGRWDEATLQAADIACVKAVSTAEFPERQAERLAAFLEKSPELRFGGHRSTLLSLYSLYNGICCSQVLLFLNNE